MGIAEWGKFYLNESRWDEKDFLVFCFEFILTSIIKLGWLKKIGSSLRNECLFLTVCKTLHLGIGEFFVLIQ